MNSTHPLLSQVSSPHYLVIENLRGFSSSQPYVWREAKVTGNIVGMTRSYPAAKKTLPTPSWPTDAEARATLEKHFPARALQLSCGGVVDQRQPLSFADHPKSLASEDGGDPKDQILFGRTFTILWMAAGDEEQIAAAMADDRALLANHFEKERERVESSPSLFSLNANQIVRRWLDEWYLSRLCRLANQSEIDVNRIRQILAATS